MAPRTTLLLSEWLDDDPLVVLGARLGVRRDAAVPREDPLRVPVAPEGRLAPDARVAFFAVEPGDGLERAAFFAVAGALRLARAGPFDAAAAFVCPLLEREGRDAAAALVCPLLERGVRDAALDVLLALLRAVVAGLREPPLRALALLLAVFRFVCFPELLVVAIRFPFPGLIKRYPVLGGR